MFVKNLKWNHLKKGSHVTELQNTLGGKRYPPSSSYTSSQMQAIGWPCSDWQVKESKPLPPRQLNYIKMFALWLDLLSQLLRNLTHVLSFGYLPQRFVKSKIRRCDDPSICSEFLLTHGMLKIKTCCERLRAAIRAFELFLNCY